MKRRDVLRGAVALSFAPKATQAADWRQLEKKLGRKLIKVTSPLTPCVGSSDAARIAEVFAKLRNPYYLGDEPGLTQTLGWVDAWTSRPSAYAVAAETTADVAAAVNFARARKLRLIIRGGGHSYKGASNAAESLMIWTRRMDQVAMHEAFIAEGCGGPEVPAMSIGAGALWGKAYDAAANEARRYVQGGGCLTVGVAGLIQSGGFGPFSKAYGMAAASLIEAEIVTADGRVRIANACTHPDLFWALKGGGGGSFGVVTRLTLRLHDFPNFFGGVFATIKAASAEAFRRLIGKAVGFYAKALLNPHWGEQMAFRPNRELVISMVFQGLDQRQAEAVWQPFFEDIRNAPQDYTLAAEPMVIAAPARDFWTTSFLKTLTGLVLRDDRPGARGDNLFWASNQGEAGQVLHAYQSAWLPQSLLEISRQEMLAEALFHAARHWSVSLHFNKGLAGAPEAAIVAARDSAMNPLALDAFALAIIAAESGPAYPGVPGHEPDIAVARREAEAVTRAMGELRRILPSVGSYGAESDFFEKDWQNAFWGRNYARLLEIKKTYDPGGLFRGHHGVGSDHDQ